MVFVLAVVWGKRKESLCSTNILSVTKEFSEVTQFQSKEKGSYPDCFRSPVVTIIWVLAHSCIPLKPLTTNLSVTESNNALHLTALKCFLSWTDLCSLPLVLSLVHFCPFFLCTSPLVSLSFLSSFFFHFPYNSFSTPESRNPSQGLLCLVSCRELSREMVKWKREEEWNLFTSADGLIVVSPHRAYLIGSVVMKRRWEMDVGRWKRRVEWRGGALIVTKKEA